MSTFDLAFYNHHADKKPQCVRLTWEQIGERIRTAQIGDKDGLAWSFVRMKPGATRGAEGIEAVTMLVLDVDGADDNRPSPKLSVVVKKLEKLKLTAYCHTTASSKPEAQRYRVIVQPDRPFSLAYLKYNVIELAKALELSSFVDKSSHSKAQMSYLTRLTAERLHEYEVYQSVGKPYVIEDREFEEPKPRADPNLVARTQTNSIRSSEIDDFNAQVSVEEVLLEFGYEEAQDGRWICPESKSRSPGVSILDNGDGTQKVYSFHSSDGLNTQSAHDAFSILMHLQCNGKQSAALKAARQFLNAPNLWRATAKKQSAVKAWNEITKYEDEIKSEPFPLEAFPEPIRQAISEVHTMMQAPLALVCASALGALSGAGQGLANVQRASGLIGPTSLYILAVAKSGERKSTIDKLFCQPLVDFQKSKRQELRQKTGEYEIDLQIHEMQVKTLTNKLKRITEGKDNIAEDESIEDVRLGLSELQREVPEKPLMPRLLIGDDTSQRIAQSLANEWPSAVVSSSEAALVLGSYSMKPEQILQTLAMFNLLWDGAPVNVGRKTSDDVIIESARLTIALQIQPEALRDFLDSSRGLPRGVGFLARFLLSHPESTQGTRMFKETTTNGPGLRTYHNCLRSMLDAGFRRNESGELDPHCLFLAHEARDIWIDWYNRIESKLAPYQEYESVSDIASKAADNVARIAGLFHLFNYYYRGGCGSEFKDSDLNIDPSDVSGAGKIVEWYLGEAKRLLASDAEHGHLSRVRRLEKFLVMRALKLEAQCVPLQDTLRLGPLRKLGQRDEALEVLLQNKRIQIVHENRVALVYLHPEILKQVGIKAQ